MIGPDRLRRAEHLIDSSGVVELIATSLRKDRRGRRANVNKLRVFLIGLYLSIENERSGSITTTADLLHRGLTLDDQYRLQIRDRANGKLLITRHDLYYLTKTFSERFGYGASVADADTSTGSDGITAEVRAERHTTLMTICRSLLDTTIAGPEPTAFAIDATGIWSWGKGPRKPSSTEISALVDNPADIQNLENPLEPGDDETLTVGSKSVHDPDAAWGIKTAKSGRTEIFFGYHEHTVVQIPGDTEHPDAAPRLIRAFELTPANHDIVDVSLRLLDSVHDGNGKRLLLADNHYHYKQLDRWLQPLRQRDWDPLHDLRVDEQGFVEYDRMRWAAGDAHCPATPDALGTITRPALNDRRRESHDKFHQQIDLRHAYAMPRHTVPDLDGAHRVTCPALAGNIGCPHRAGTTASAIALGLPIVENPPNPNSPEGLPACCTQKTVLVRPPAKIAKLYQTRYWGSREWAELYARRSYVEGSYGNRKNNATENLRRGLFHITGLPLVHLMLTMVNMSYNLRMIENWHQRHLKANRPRHVLDPNHPLLVNDNNIAGYRAITITDEYDSNDPAAA